MICKLAFETLMFVIETMCKKFAQKRKQHVSLLGKLQCPRFPANFPGKREINFPENSRETGNPGKETLLATHAAVPGLTTLTYSKLELVQPESHVCCITRRSLLYNTRGNAAK
jgi:hypothetical protein